MEDKNLDIIHQYLNKEIDIEELKMQLSDDEFEYWKATLALVSELPQPKFNSQKEYELLIQKRTATSETRWGFFYVAAASVLLLLGSWYAFYMTNNQNQTITIAYQENNKENMYYLPDSSKVYLNKRSSITYESSIWKESRQIQLIGEAYFSVKKGEKFSVNSKNGTVEVLGTTFNVLDRNDILEVTCYSGKVAVKHNNDKIILNPKQAFSSADGQITIVSKEVPEYAIRWSMFDEAPLLDVIKTISEIKHVSIDLKLDKNYIFTGGFSNDMTADDILTLVCKTLNLSYRFVEKNQYEISNSSKP